MNWIIVMALILLWVLGLVNGYFMGGVIHILPVCAFIVAAYTIIQKQRKNLSEKQGIKTE